MFLVITRLHYFIEEIMTCSYKNCHKRLVSVTTVSSHTWPHNCQYFSWCPIPLTGFPLSPSVWIRPGAVSSKHTWPLGWLMKYSHYSDRAAVGINTLGIREPLPSHLSILHTGPGKHGAREKNRDLLDSFILFYVPFSQKLELGGGAGQKQRDLGISNTNFQYSRPDLSILLYSKLVPVP